MKNLYIFVIFIFFIKINLFSSEEITSKNEEISKDSLQDILNSLNESNLKIEEALKLLKKNDEKNTLKNKNKLKFLEKLRPEYEIQKEKFKDEFNKDLNDLENTYNSNKEILSSDLEKQENLIEERLKNRKNKILEKNLSKNKITEEITSLSNGPSN